MKNYRKKGVQPMIPWNNTTVMKFVSISDADLANGSPKMGDMIAANPNDQTDLWLVAEKYFNENYEEAPES